MPTNIEKIIYLVVFSYKILLHGMAKILYFLDVFKVQVGVLMGPVLNIQNCYFKSDFGKFFIYIYNTMPYYCVQTCFLYTSSTFSCLHALLGIVLFVISCLHFTLILMVSKINKKKQIFFNFVSDLFALFSLNSFLKKNFLKYFYQICCSANCLQDMRGSTLKF